MFMTIIVCTTMTCKGFQHFLNKKRVYSPSKHLAYKNQ
nr:MAG TPA: hypothetical protein [Caudoviricetes sp.]